MMRYTKKGFTLLEIMITMAILAVLLVTVFQTQSEIANVLFYSKNRKIAQDYVQSKVMEKIIESKKVNLGERRGNFPDESELRNFNWYEKVEKAKIFTIPVIKTTIRLNWKENNVEKKYQSILFSEDKI